MRPAVEWNSERADIGDAAAADVIGGFKQHVTATGGGDTACSGDPGRPGADDDDIGLARARRGRAD